MIFIRYELGSKGYQFWDTAHQCFKISHNVKFEETCFPAKEMTLAQPGPAPSSSHQIPKLDNVSDSLVLDLVKLVHSPLGHPAQANLHRANLHHRLNHQCLPLLYCQCQRGNIVNYKAWRLFHNNPQYLNTHCILERDNSNWVAKLDPQQRVSAMC